MNAQNVNLRRTDPMYTHCRRHPGEEQVGPGPGGPAASCLEWGCVGTSHWVRVARLDPVFRSICLQCATASVAG